ncbi:hypothetical protein H4S08_002886 [Coemansia sp. RSA 1365]|nr:hypothetical protein H4S08_002886 [Coemansia sp. RSA 1365]
MSPSNKEDEGPSKSVTASVQASSREPTDVIMAERGPAEDGFGRLRASEVLDILKTNIPKYSGNADTELMSADTWCNLVEAECADYRQAFLPAVFKTLIQSLLMGEMQKGVARHTFDTPEALLQHLQDKFNKQIFQCHLLERIESGSVFRGCGQMDILQVLEDLSQEVMNHNELKINQLSLDYNDYQQALTGLERSMQSNPVMTPKLFRKAKAEVKPETKSGSAKNVSEKLEPSKSTKESHNKKRRAAQRKKQQEAVDEIKKLKGELKSLTADSKTRKQAVKAVADPGAEVSVITLEAAQRLNQKVNTNQRPWLKPMWSGAEYRAYGRVKALVDIADGPRRWLDLVVVDDMQKWDLLLGNADLEHLDVRLETPAMRRR